MGVLNYLFDNEWAQRADIEDTKRRLDAQSRIDREARGRLREGLEGRIQALEDEGGQVALFVRTLFRLLVEKGTLSKPEFLEAARAIDAQDGTVDGKYRGRLDAT